MTTDDGGCARAGCEDGGADLFHCHGVLVLHADGTVECDEWAACGGEEGAHGWWVACDELRCGCAGDDAPLVEVLLLAA